MGYALFILAYLGLCAGVGTGLYWVGERMADWWRSR